MLLKRSACTNIEMLPVVVLWEVQRAGDTPIRREYMVLH